MQIIVGGCERGAPVDVGRAGPSTCRAATPGASISDPGIHGKRRFASSYAASKTGRRLEPRYGARPTAGASRLEPRERGRGPIEEIEGGDDPPLPLDRAMGIADDRKRDERMIADLGNHTVRLAPKSPSGASGATRRWSAPASGGPDRRLASCAATTTSPT
ncbi:hypothetical protein KF840_01625 [bacterium]|nr:hypothetical protein [bacterium]